ncbi:MAG: NAD(P)-dependent oxidoreductase [Actinomycetota bacterium]|nr:NAD(P)-dependent oxidoreductase [Actinomycetota bacterium]
MADVLVTGATGLLGSRVVQDLAREHEVVALARRPPPDPGGVRWIRHDLRSPALPADLPPGIEAVVHLAQAREFREFPSRALDTFAVNVGSTVLLADWACRAGARRLVLASTGGVYRPSSEPHREDEPVGGPDVPSFYAASKLAAETLARAYSSELVVTVLRPFFVYGAGQEAGMLLPRLVGSVRAGAAVRLDGHDGMRFNPVHVSDAARAVIAALAMQEGGVVNVAGPEVLSLRRAVELLGQRLGTPPTFEIRPDAAPTDFVADISTMAATLGPPTTRLADVVDELCR